MGMIALLAGCSSNSAGSSSSSSASSSSAAASSTATSASASSAQSSAQTTSGKVLVAYYSATGNTEQVAKRLSSALDATLFEVEPKDPYTDDDLDWSDENSRVSQEHDDSSKRDVALTQTTPDNWDSFDTVLVGYPIWWSDAAWPIDHFVSDNDFAGKRVITFCTSQASGLGESTDNLAEMAGTGDWEDGQRFPEEPSNDDIDSWANSLGL
jgi:flavodoxin